MSIDYVIVVAVPAVQVAIIMHLSIIHCSALDVFICSALFIMYIIIHVKLNLLFSTFVNIP